MTRVGWAAAVASLLVLGACGAATTTQVGAGAGATTTTTAALRTVSYGGATFEVPSAWPVYDLTATPHRCARFDTHAVYLGHQAADAACPARILGKTEAVQVEPDDQFAQARVVPVPATAQVNGQPVAYEPGGAAEHQIVATFPRLDIVVTATYGTDAAMAQQIVASVAKSGS
jgi:hypothetical protein